MRSLVLGASGIVGGHIVKQLVLDGERPLAVSRAPQPASDAVEWLQADLAHFDAVQLPDLSTVFCTAHSALLAKALPRLHQAALRRVVLFTSTSIVTKIDSEIAAERDGLRRLAEGEQQTIALCEQFGVGWTVLRPTMIYDEGRDANVSRLAGLIRRFGVMPLSGMGGGLRQPVHAQDLAIGALQAARSDAATNKIYALPGGDTISYREMVGRIFDGLGKPRRIVPVPPALWRVAFAAARQMLPNANVAMGDRMSKDMVFDATPAIRDFGWAPRGFRPRFE
jgi:nucleoside-diphosphate-sugar epimerase